MDITEYIDAQEIALDAAKGAWAWALETVNPRDISKVAPSQWELMAEMVSEQLQHWCDRHPEAPESLSTKTFGETVEKGLHQHNLKAVKETMIEMEKNGLAYEKNGGWQLTAKGRAEALRRKAEDDQQEGEHNP